MAQNKAVMSRGARVCAFALCALTASAAAQTARPADAGAVFRVFLRNGEALPSYGEAAVAGGRVVFTLIVGAPDDQRMQLVSLPAGSVDLDRTGGYANALRAAHYGATRGETDFAAMAQEVQRTLAEVTSVGDPKKRLALAEGARRRLQAWAAGTYGYRAAEVRELTDLFDEVINTLRAAAGERQFSLDLRSGRDPAPEPLLPAPSLSESIRLTLEAVKAVDSEDDRLALLRTASAVTASAPDGAALHERVTRELDREASATAAYAVLAADVRARADVARRRGDVAGVSAAIARLRAGDRELGERRPETTAALLVELEATLARVKSYREAMDRYVAIRPVLFAYERAVRPVMSGLDGLAPVFTAVRDDRYSAYERLERAGARLSTFAEALQAIDPPPDLSDVHATLLSAVRMALHAVTRRRLAVASGSRTVVAEASSAAAGALLLAAQARETLVVRLYPPKIQ
jgi:hypothetical protein